MPFAEIGAFLLALVIIFLVGNLWFRLVEALLDRIRSRLTRHKEPPAWHPLPQDETDRDP